ncbi:hypothetical protein BOTBODRAFT_113614, partial [Botryobasidium botryosum FD-172 SS1]
HAAEYPVIQCIARDVLAIPATSVSVERLFSHSSHLCVTMRSSLQAETITETMHTREWIKEGLLPDLS